MDDQRTTSTGLVTEQDETMSDVERRLAVLEQQVSDLMSLLPETTQPEQVSSLLTPDRAAKAKELFDAQGIYKRGCSEFVCAVLGLVKYEQAKALMGTNPTEITDWSAVPAGAIVGWQMPNGPADHVSVYVNDGTSKFIDVRQPASSAVPEPKPRRLPGYGKQKMYLSTRFGT